jgi:DNA-directed RNA polymerase subunit RPC12/RpoP
MWRCSNCGTGIEDKYAHCWQCGAPNVVKQRTQTATREDKTAREQALPEDKSVPDFASYEELAHVPSRPMWFLRRGPLQRLFYFLLVIILVKILSSQFLGKYGVYIVAGVAVIALIMILWGFFRRDPQEGVGVKLN